MKKQFWNITLTILGACIVSFGVISDQTELKEEDMNSVYGSGKCVMVTTVPHPSCTPTTCPESGYITQNNYGQHKCTYYEALMGYQTCIPFIFKPTRDECETWIYNTSACTDVIFHTVSAEGPNLIATQIGLCVY